VAGPTAIVLALSCPDRIGIVYAVSGFLGAHELNIVESQQFGDPNTHRFFLRVEAHATSTVDLDALRSDFETLAEEFSMSWALHDPTDRPVLLILVSRLGHCLNDLLYRHRTGALAAAIPAVVSNHPDLAPVAEMYGIPFHHLPIEPDGQAAQEQLILAMVDDLGVDLAVLARYMQILSPSVVDHLPSRIINIHHGLLPGFEGASPHRQAFDAGVKVIGATAHYVTSELDRGPIIEQTVDRVDHAATPATIQSLTHDLECRALARAVQWHLEHRVLCNGTKTVVFA